MNPWKILRILPIVLLLTTVVATSASEERLYGSPQKIMNYLSQAVQGSDPAAPGAGFTVGPYPKSSGIYYRDSGGVKGPLLYSGGSGTSWTMAGDSGSSQTITLGDTATIAGGTTGIDTVASATDTLTVNFDPTEVGTVTWGTGSTWIFPTSINFSTPFFSVRDGLNGPGAILLYEDGDNGNNFCQLIAPALLAANSTWTMPPVDVSWSGLSHPATTEMLVMNAGGAVTTQTIAGGISGTGTDKHPARWDGTADIEDVPNWTYADTTGKSQFNGAEPGDSALDVLNSSTTGASIGINGTASGATGATIGVRGITNSSDNAAYGGYFDQMGVVGWADVLSSSAPAAPASGKLRFWQTDDLGYQIADTGEIGLAPRLMYSMVSASDFALSTSSGVQSCFESTGDVWSLAASTTYEIDGLYYITRSVNAVTTAMAFAFSSAPTSILYQTEGGNGNTVNTVQAGSSGTFCLVNQAASTVVQSIQATGCWIKFHGHIRTNGATTVTPQIDFSGTVTSPVMKANSYVKFTPMGTSTQNTVGNVN